GRNDWDQAADLFDQAWHEAGVRRAPPPVLAQYLPPAGDPRRRPLLRLLVPIDLERRWDALSRGWSSAPAAFAAADTTGTPAATLPFAALPRLEDYVRCYPDLGPVEELPPALICAEYRVRQRWGDRPKHDEYRQRFPRQAAALAPALAEVDAE